MLLTLALLHLFSQDPVQVPVPGRTSTLLSLQMPIKENPTKQQSRKLVASQVHRGRRSMGILNGTKNLIETFQVTCNASVCSPWLCLSAPRGCLSSKGDV